MGGCVAQAFAGLNLSRVNALGLIDTTAWYGADAPKNWRERAAVARSKGLAGMVEFQVTRWFSDRFRIAHPELVKEMTDVFLANDVECYAATCIMLGDADLRPVFAVAAHARRGDRWRRGLRHARRHGAAVARSNSRLHADHTPRWTPPDSGRVPGPNRRAAIGAIGAEKFSTDRGEA